VELKQDGVSLWTRSPMPFDVSGSAWTGFAATSYLKSPWPAWQYIIAACRMNFPKPFFVLEGLGGFVGTTENLLTVAGRQWALLELFQNYSGGRLRLSGLRQRQSARSAPMFIQ